MARRYCKNTVPGKQGRGRKYPAAVRAEVVMAMIGSNSICAVARKYGVDYAITKDQNVIPPKYTVFFKAKDADALPSAFEEFTNRKLKAKEKPSVLEQLNKLKELVAAILPDKVRHKSQERDL